MTVNANTIVVAITPNAQECCRTRLGADMFTPSHIHCVALSVGVCVSVCECVGVGGGGGAVSPLPVSIQTKLTA